ncbi:MAG: S8 family serine peptidase [Thermoanaerobaculia bacterium]|jgi:subtilisin family serine protease
MKTILSTLFATTIALGAFAEAPETHRYLVATREQPQIVSSKIAGGGAGIVTFTAVRGFAATMTADEARRLALDPNVRFVEPDPKRYLDVDREAPRAAASARLASAPEAQVQIVPFGIPLVQAPSIWSLARGAGIKVGVVDTGIDSRHPDLAGHFHGGESFVGTGLSPLQDGVGHGTHVAGTIGAIDNGEGVVGVAPEAELYSLRVFDESGEFTNASALIEAIDWAIAHGIRVLNMSLGGPENSLLEREAFDRAAQNGVLIFASSGNDGKRLTNYPAAYDGAVGVGAVDFTLARAGFSTFGDSVKIVGPGVSVLSTFPVDNGFLSLITGTGIPGIAADLMDNSPAGRVSGGYVYCNLGMPADFPAAVSGKIALIERGELTFAEKAKNAKAAGAIGVIVFNNIPGGFNGTLGDESFAWPVTVGISQEEGDALIAAAPGTTITIDFVQGYDFLSGTSMSCPHVSGVAALIWSLKPQASAAEVRDAILRSATDLGKPGWDEMYGFGEVNAFAAAKALAPELFPRKHPLRR